MNRTRTGRGAPPWAWMQTGPLTIDVESRMSNRDRQGTALAVPQTTTHSGVSTPEGSPFESPTVSKADANNAPHEDGLLANLPAFRAAMESLEKRGDPILVPAEEKTAVAKSTAKRPHSKTPAKRKRNLLGARTSRRPSVPRKQSQPKTQAQIDVMRHARVCTICHHPEREAIEEAFLQWRNVKFIAKEFHATGGPTSIYRHARALNLFQKRNLTLRSSLEFVIEQSERIMPTAEGLVKAIRAYTRINDAGEWIDTPTTHIVKVVAMSADGRNHENPASGLTLDVRKDRSNILYPSSAQVESAACPDEGRLQQQLLPGSAQNVESDVTL